MADHQGETDQERLRAAFLAVHGLVLSVGRGEVRDIWTGCCRLAVHSRCEPEARASTELQVWLRGRQELRLPDVACQARQPDAARVRQPDVAYRVFRLDAAQKASRAVRKWVRRRELTDERE
jgi:hypothetical protein